MRVMLDYCVSPRDRASIQVRLNLRNQKDARQRCLMPAMAAGWLTMTDPAHPNSPAQKYRTTPLGLALLNVEEGQEEADALASPPPRVL